MELNLYKERIQLFIKKYKYVLVVVGVGVILLHPTSKKEKQEVITQPTENIFSVEQQLSGILSRMEGAGTVEVFLTQASGEEIFYQEDEDYSSSSEGYTSRSDTVTVSGSDRNETGLIRQINPPKYLGAIILCQGGNNPAVRLAVVEAVSRVTGLGADKISVLKMK